MITALASVSAQRLVHLSPVDLAIIIFYFALVLAIGFYLKQRANTSEDYFMAGREMTAWIAGLSFLSANLGSLELMGWAGASYQYGILAAHWYWIGAIPAMLFLGIVMMPFYYISKTHSVPGYLKLRFGESSRTLSSVSFAFMTVLMSGINMYSMALVLKVVVVRSKATTLALPFPTKRVLLSGLKASPSGAESGLTPLARAAQHCAPGKPPNRPLAPKVGMWKFRVRQPKRVQLPDSVTIGGIKIVAEGSTAQGLALTPPPATPFAPEKKFTAIFC